MFSKGETVQNVNTGWIGTVDKVDEDKQLYFVVYDAPHFLKDWVPGQSLQTFTVETTDE
jgi:hypothetical protein